MPEPKPTESAEQWVTVRHSVTGTEKDVQAKHLQSWLARGWVVITPEQKAQEYLKEKHGEGAGNAVLAGIAGVNRTLTGGLSDVWESAVGGEQAREKLRTWQQERPTASMVGELTGMVPGMLTGGAEAGLLRKAGSATFPALAGQVGVGIERSMAGQVPGLARRTLAGAAGAAGEMGLYGIQQTVTENALDEDPVTMQQAASRLASNVATNAAVGGVMGAGAELLSSAVLARANRAAQHQRQAIVEDAEASAKKSEAVQANPDLEGLDRAALEAQKQVEVVRVRVDREEAAAARKAEAEQLEAVKAEERRKIATQVEDFGHASHESGWWYAHKNSPIDAVREAEKITIDSDKTILRRIRNPKDLPDKLEPTLSTLREQENGLSTFLSAEPEIRNAVAAEQQTAAKNVEGAIARAGKTEETASAVNLETHRHRHHGRLPREETMPPAMSVEDRVHQTATELALGPGGRGLNQRHYINELKDRLPDIPTAQVERALEQLQVDGKLVLYRLDDPTEITAARRAGAMRIGAEERHIFYLTDAWQRPSADLLPAPMGGVPAKVRLSGDTALDYAAWKRIAIPPREKVKIISQKKYMRENFEDAVRATGNTKLAQKKVKADYAAYKASLKDSAVSINVSLKEAQAFRTAALNGQLPSAQIESINQAKDLLNTNRWLQEKIQGVLRPIESPRLVELDAKLESMRGPFFSTPRLDAIGAKLEEHKIAQEMEQKAKKLTLLQRGLQWGAASGATAAGMGAGLPWYAAGPIGLAAGKKMGDIFAARNLKKLNGALKKGAAETGSRISKALDAFADVGKKAPKATPFLASKVLKGHAFAPTAYVAPAMDSGDDKVDSFRQREAELRSITFKDVDGSFRIRDSMRAQIHEQLSGVRWLHPLLADRMEMLAVRKLEWLASKLPMRPALAGVLAGPDRWQPSDMALHTFARYVDATEHPEHILERLAEGTITPEDTDTLRTVWVDLYAAVQVGILERLSMLKQTLPYDRRIMLGMIFNVPTDASLKPRIRDLLQGNFAQEPGTSGGTEAPKAQPRFGPMGSLPKRGGTLSEPTVSQRLSASGGVNK